uniref:Uncharacterized protein n=1 Tax=Rhizophora mucronata TaxID=61149 RepID=A0A2P2PBU9_RHIMU
MATETAIKFNFFQSFSLMI